MRLAYDEQDLLARLLSPTLGDSAVECAARLMNRFGSLGACVAAPTAEILRVLGLEGAACAHSLADLQRLIVTVLRRRLAKRPILGSRTVLDRYLLTSLTHEPREQFRVLYLDKRNGLIAEEVVGTGTLDHAPVYPREVVRRAVDQGASALILVHNHPSGDPEPSAQDLLMTDKIVAGCAVFGIEVHDHIVVGRGETFSFYANGLMARGETAFEHSEWLLKRRTGGVRKAPRIRPVRTASRGQAGAADVALG